MYRESLIDFSRYNFYEDGRIWSKCSEKWIDGNIGTKKYLQVWLKCIDGKKRYFLKHRAIAYYFIPNPDNKPTINHKNHIRTDNRVNNLEWATYPEQCDEIQKEKHSQSLRQSKKAIKSSINNFKKASEMNKKTIYKYTLDGKLVGVYKSVKDAGESVGAFPQNISSCCRGKCKQIKGYKWSFKPL